LEGTGRIHTDGGSCNNMWTDMECKPIWKMDMGYPRIDRRLITGTTSISAYGMK
jgi:hypothetical protein